MTDKSGIRSELDKADRLIRSGKRAEAVMIYHQVKDLAGSDPALNYRLGVLNLNIGDIDQAVEHFEICVAEQPGNPDYLCSLGTSLLSSGSNSRAASILEEALEIDENLHDALHGLGRHYIIRGQGDKAVGFMRRAIEQKPNDFGTRMNLARALTMAGEHEEAISTARKAVRQDPKDPGARLELATALTEKGALDEAREQIEATIRQDRTYGPAYDALARVKTFTAKDDAIVRTAEKALETSMPPNHRYSLEFALGKIHADRGDYDKSWDHYEKANTLRNPGLALDHESRFCRQAKSALTGKLVSEFEGIGSLSVKPVFIVGMPRSGTTLMEQIIAAHPRAAGAGELPVLSDLAARFFPKEKIRNHPAFVRKQMTPDVVSECAEEYLEVLSAGRESAERVVDKMPANFFFIGLIRILFPRAAVIHAVRNPLDTALSCYQQNFSDQHWTNTPESIAEFYSLYRDIMAHWNKTLPEGSYTGMRYESLVSDPETEARRLLDACGLDWDPGVLEFFRKESVVSTASKAQVRQPIYTTSRQKWVKYGKHIEPLAKAMAPHLQEDDLERLAEIGIDVGSSRGGFMRRLFG